MLHRLTYRPHMMLRNCLDELFDSFLSLDLQKEPKKPAMNGASGFHEMRPSILFRSPAYWFMSEQRHQFWTDFWRLLDIHNRITLSTGISTKRETVPVRDQDPRATTSYPGCTRQVVTPSRIRPVLISKRDQEIERRFWLRSKVGKMSLLCQTNEQAPSASI